ncbi:asparaginase [Magnetovibrio sp.]|uniref:asparaginase n=1 Tax=Magnetovibrio sp. TaxID=2024836 RepID=UPI002F92ACB8
MTTSNPVFIEVTRAGFVESRHRGACAVVDADGQMVHAWGDVEALVYPRSALKPIQALPLIETGAADHYGLGDEEIALACASHNSEPFHVERVTAWLERVGLTVDDLECGVCEAISLDVTKAMSSAHEPFTRAHNNCSGKHTGFLSTALFMGEATKGYIGAHHPVQQRVTKTVEEMTGVSLSSAPCGSDGCGIPVFAFPLHALARGMARMMSKDLAASRKAAANRVMAAMVACPQCVAGTKRFDTRVMTACKGEVLVKGGAEGVHIAMIPAKGLGIALKVDDGTIRASEQAMGCILDGLGLLPEAARSELADLIEMPVRSTLGERVGEIRKGPGLMF